MSLKDKIFELGEITSDACVTISFNTHRTHPENGQDRVVLKNLLSQAQDLIVELYSGVDTEQLLKRLSRISDKIDIEHNLESLNIFLSNETQDIVKTTWPVPQNSVYISDRFALRPLIDADSRSKEYLVMLLSQGGTSLYEAMNDGISFEIINKDFPFPESPFIIGDKDKASDAKKIDRMVREYLNIVDKALLEVHKSTGLECVVICDDDNYSKLMQVSDKPEMYLGYAPVDYSKCQPHEIAIQSWELVQDVQSARKEDLVEEIDSAVSAGRVVTDLQEIFQAALDGRADLLLVNQDYTQPVKMTSDRTFDLADDEQAIDTNSDLVNDISWAVIKNDGRVNFVPSDRLKRYGNIVLKTRY